MRALTDWFGWGEITLLTWRTELADDETRMAVSLLSGVGSVFVDGHLAANHVYKSTKPQFDVSVLPSKGRMDTSARYSRLESGRLGMAPKRGRGSTGTFADISDKKFWDDETR